MADLGTQPCSDMLTIGDSFARVVAYNKSLGEAGLTPGFDVYPSSSLFPTPPMIVTDTPVTLLTIYRDVPDGFTTVDTIGKGVDKTLSDTFGISDSIINEFISYLAETNISISDIVSSGVVTQFIVACSVGDTIDSFGIGRHFGESLDFSDSTMKGIGKYIVEVGLLPGNLLPASNLYPQAGVSIDDAVSIGTLRSLSDSFSIDDIDGIENIIGKNIDENIHLLDIILFNVLHAIEQNIVIVDSITKSPTVSISYAITVEEDIVKTTMKLLRGSIDVDDNDTVDKTIRTLVRASLRAIKVDRSSLQTR